MFDKIYAFLFVRNEAIPAYCVALGWNFNLERNEDASRLVLTKSRSANCIALSDLDIHTFTFDGQT